MTTARASLSELKKSVVTLPPVPKVGSRSPAAAWTSLGRVENETIAISNSATIRTRFITTPPAETLLEKSTARTDQHERITGLATTSPAVAHVLHPL